MAKLYEIRELRDKRFVFKDRDHAGEVLAALLKPAFYKKTDALVLGIPSGGVPIAVAVSTILELPMDLLLIKKIPVPGNPEAGMGAVIHGGRFFLNDWLIERLGITPAQVQAQIERVKEELRKRDKIFRGGRPMPDVKGKTVLIVDDGLASGFTMLAAARWVRAQGASPVVVAVPTGSSAALERLGNEVDEIYCANQRSGPYFAVADAYENWYDLQENEVLERLKRANYLKKGDPQ